MEKTLVFVATNVDGTVISALDNLQPYSVRLSKKEGERLLCVKGLKVIPYQKDRYYNFDGKEPLVNFFGVRGIERRTNTVMHCEADSFEFLESEEK